MTIAEWQVDLDQTGGKLERPGLDRIMERVRSGESGGVAVASLDRLSRAGVGDALRLIEEIHEHGGQLAIIDLGLDPTTELGEFAITILLALARLQRRQITRKWATAQEYAVERGVHISSVPPTGMTRGKDGRLSPHPRWAPIVAEGIGMRATGASWSKVAEYFNAQKLPTPYGSKRWHGGSVQNVIRNRVYLGEARGGTFTKVGAHEAIVDVATFEAAQVARGVRAGRSAEPALLSGLLRCAGCRHSMKPDKMTLRDGSRVRTYRCRGNHSSGRCEHRAAVLGSVIEPHVVEALFDAVGELEASGVLRTGDVEATIERLRDAEDERDAFLATAKVLKMGAESYEIAYRAHERDVEEARSELARVTADLAGQLPTRAQLEADWPNMSAEDRRRMLSGAFDVIFVRTGRGLPISDRVLPLSRGEGPADLPGRGKHSNGALSLRPFPWPEDAPLDARKAAA